MIRRLVTAAIAGGLAFLGAAANAQDYPPQPPLGTPKPFSVPASETYTLPNGMQVTLIPYGLAPKATVNLRVYAGNLNEGDDVWLSTLTAQMLREGAASRTGSQIAEAAAAMGGNLSIGATAHETTLALNVLSEDAADAVRLISDLARRPDFPASELERIRASLLRGLAVAKSQPQPAADAVLASTYYGTSHPYGRLYPTEAQLKAYTLADIRRFYTENFGARRARLYVAGRFDATAVRAAIEQAYGDWQPGPDRLQLKPTIHPGPRVLLVNRPGAPQSTVRIAFPAPVAGDPSDIKFRVTDALLGGSFTSRITSNIREDKGYTYSPGSAVNFNAGEAMWTFEADVTTNVTGPALKEVFGEIRRLQNEAPPEDEAAGMRTWMAGIFILQNASPNGLIGSLSQRDFHGLPADWLDSYVPAVLSTTAAEMRGLARDRFPLDRMTVVVVGDLAKVRSQLQALPELRKAKFETVTPF